MIKSQFKGKNIMRNIKDLLFAGLLIQALENIKCIKKMMKGDI